MSVSEFNYIVLEHSDGLQPFAISLTRDSEQAKDLYQETLYKAFANRDKYLLGTNVRAWLYTIMRNIFINDYRRKAKLGIISKDITGLYCLSENPGPAFNNAASNILLKEIHEKINRLPEIFKRPFTLYFEGYKYHEIAYVMHEPLGTIKSRIHFARKLLKEQIGKN